MRARYVLAPALVISALASACSNPAPEPAAERDTAFDSELELALFADAETGQSAAPTVVSELELARPDEAGQSPAPAPARRETAPASDVTRPVMLLGQPAPLAVPEAAETPVTLVADATPVETGEEVAESGADHADHGGSEARDGSGSRGPIIIRGGVAAGDPCKLHIPGHGGADPRGAIGVLINDKVPYGIGGRGNPTYTDRRRAGAGRLGGGFPGGIR